MDNEEKLATGRRTTKQAHQPICVGHYYAQKKNINNVNKIHDNGRGNHEERYKEPACETTTMGRCV
jgi:hypothetical protein